MLLPKDFTSSDKAAIWLPPSGGFASFDPSLEDLKNIDLNLLSDSLRNFFFHRLPRILAMSRDTVKWHLNPLCKTCPYQPECRARATRERTIGSMPNISLDDAHVLENLLDISRRYSEAPRLHDKTEIEDLHRLFADKSKQDALEQSYPSTFRKAKRILGIPNRSDKKRRSISSSVEAARTKRIQVRTLTIGVILPGHLL